MVRSQAAQPSFFLSAEQIVRRRPIAPGAIGPRATNIPAGTFVWRHAILSLYDKNTGQLLLSWHRKSPGGRTGDYDVWLYPGSQHLLDQYGCTYRDYARNRNN